MTKLNLKALEKEGRRLSAGPQGDPQFWADLLSYAGNVPALIAKIKEMTWRFDEIETHVTLTMAEPKPTITNEDMLPILGICHRALEGLESPDSAPNKTKES